MKESSFNRKFVSAVYYILSFTAFVIYLYAIVQVGQLSLASPNFVEKINDLGVKTVEVAAAPTSGTMLTLILTLLSGYLIKNFSNVTGISIKEVPMLKPGELSGFYPSNTQTGMNRKLASALRSLKHFYKNAVKLHPKYWGVIAYLLGFAIAVLYIVADGGIGNGFDAIAPELKMLSLTFLGVLAATVDSLSVDPS